MPTQRTKLVYGKNYEALKHVRRYFRNAEKINKKIFNKMVRKDMKVKLGELE